MIDIRLWKELPLGNLEEVKKHLAPFEALGIQFRIEGVEYGNSREFTLSIEDHKIRFGHLPILYVPKEND